MGHQLRGTTSAPIGECKKALEASDGDMDKAFDWLRAKGAAKASDLGKREANEGIVSVSQGSDFEAALVQVRGVLCRQQYTRDARAEPWPMADRCPPPP